MNKVLSSVFEKQITFTILPRLKELEFRIQFASQRFLNRKGIKVSQLGSLIVLLSSTVLSSTKGCTSAVPYFSAKVWPLWNGTGAKIPLKKIQRIIFSISYAHF